MKKKKTCHTNKLFVQWEKTKGESGNMNLVNKQNEKAGKQWDTN